LSISKREDPMRNEGAPENPFLGCAEHEETDQRLVSAAVAGDREALETLVRRHQPWIYNVAFRMVMAPAEAEDVTQDVLVKVLTKLSSYDPERGAFRTWLYRIVTNHVLNMKSRGYEKHITGFETYYDFVDQIPDQDPDDTPDMALMTEDLKVGCVMGTLLCLDRRQRLAFILATAFGATDAVGSEVMEISRDTFRKTLSRARAKLRQYMNGNCGVVNPDAPCRCRKKIKSFVDSGAYTMDRLSFVAPDRPRMGEMAGAFQDDFSAEVKAPMEALHREHPFYEGKDPVPWLQEVIDRPGFQKLVEGA
jgi:RNA polymerase sigma factor (sigma-70 family)